MQRIMSYRPSPALVIAVLALVAALAGTALAGPDASTSALSKKKVRKIVTKLAPELSVADSAALGGQPPSAYASSASEPWHEVGSPGEPVFQNGWRNFGEGFGTAAFYKDPVGVVHLKGFVIEDTDPSGGTTAFTLPPGYRPSQVMFPAVGAAGGRALIIAPDGRVAPGCSGGGGGCSVPLDGVTFRAE